MKYSVLRDTILAEIDGQLKPRVKQTSVIISRAERNRLLSNLREYYLGYIRACYDLHLLRTRDWQLLIQHINYIIDNSMEVE